MPVFVEDWQVECCGTPVGIGDRVEWRLLWIEPRVTVAAATVTLDAFAGPYEMGADLGGVTVERGETPTQLDVGGLHAFWVAPRPAAGTVHLRGRLLEEHHGGVPGGFPPTVGRVERIQVVTELFVPDSERDRYWVPGAEPARYRDVDWGPERFDGEERDTGPFWTDTGVLVDLAVFGAGSA